MSCFFAYLTGGIRLLLAVAALGPPTSPPTPTGAYTCADTAGQRPTGAGFLRVAADHEANPSTARPSGLAGEERAVLDLVNRERAKAGLIPLREQAQLSRAARAHSANMARQGKLTHTLDEKTFSQRIDDAGYKSGASGENIAWAPTAAAAMDMWMHSDNHKANILSKEFQEIGVGIADSPKGKYYTLVFATPRK